MNQSLSPAQSKVAAENACLLYMFRRGTTKREVWFESYPHTPDWRPTCASELTRTAPFFPFAPAQIARVVGLHYNTVARRLKELSHAPPVVNTAEPAALSSNSRAASPSEGASAASASSAAAGALAVVAAAAAAEEDMTRPVKRPGLRRERNEIEDEPEQRSSKAKVPRSS